MDDLFSSEVSNISRVNAEVWAQKAGCARSLNSPAAKCSWRQLSSLVTFPKFVCCQCVPFMLFLSHTFLAADPCRLATRRAVHSTKQDWRSKKRSEVQRHLVPWGAGLIRGFDPATILRLGPPLMHHCILSQNFKLSGHNIYVCKRSLYVLCEPHFLNF